MFEAISAAKKYLDLAEEVQHLTAVEHVPQYIELAAELSTACAAVQALVIQLEELFGKDIEELRAKFGVKK